MPLNPTREALGQAGLRAYHHESTFKAEADAGAGRLPGATATTWSGRSAGAT